MYFSLPHLLTHHHTANRILRTHNANCFPPILLEHVCAQIDALYWSRTTTAAILQGTDEDPDAITLDTDLCDDAYVDLSAEHSFPQFLIHYRAIASLPATLPSPQDQTSPGSRSMTQRSTLESDDLATRYARARSELLKLSARRAELERRGEELRGLLTLLRPLGNADGSGSDVDGELTAELGRMRELLDRVNKRL